MSYLYNISYFVKIIWRTWNVGGGGGVNSPIPFLLSFSGQYQKRVSYPLSFVHSRFHPDFMAYFAPCNMFLLFKQLARQLPTYSLLTLDDMVRDWGPRPHWFTSKMCWCNAEMLVLNSADTKLSKKIVHPMISESSVCFCPVFTSRSNSYFYFRFHRSWLDWSKERSLILVQKGANYE